MLRTRVGGTGGCRRSPCWAVAGTVLAIGRRRHLQPSAALVKTAVLARGSHLMDLPGVGPLPGSVPSRVQFGLAAGGPVDTRLRRTPRRLMGTTPRCTRGWQEWPLAFSLPRPAVVSPRGSGLRGRTVASKDSRQGLGVTSNHDAA